MMRAIRGRKNDDKGGLELLHKFRVAAFRKLSRSVTFRPFKKKTNIPED